MGRKGTEGTEGTTAEDPPAPQQGRAGRPRHPDRAIPPRPRAENVAELVRVPAGGGPRAGAGSSGPPGSANRRKSRGFRHGGAGNNPRPAAGGNLECGGPTPPWIVGP
jgi:hypothetical protein